MHVIDYEHMVGVPRESKQHLDAVCMCGRLERVVQPAFRLVTRRSAGALRECATAMVARSMVGRPARDTAAHSSSAPTASKRHNSVFGYVNVVTISVGLRLMVIWIFELCFC